jgi:NitT/TauT family transport system substrate-binding protein
MVMTEQFYRTRKPLAEKFMRCFVQATKSFVDDKALASKYVREVVFKGQISADDFNDAIANSPFSYDISAQHIQATTDMMVKTGVGRMRAPPRAQDWVHTELLAAAKKNLRID